MMIFPILVAAALVQPVRLPPGNTPDSEQVRTCVNKHERDLYLAQMLANPPATAWKDYDYTRMRPVPHEVIDRRTFEMLYIATHRCLGDDT